MDDLILKCLQGEATDMENEKVWKWLKSRPENLQHYQQLRDVWMVSGMLRNLSPNVINRCCGRIKSKIQTGQKKFRLIKGLQKIAALLLLPALLYGGWSYFQNIKLKRVLTSIRITQEIQTQPGIRSSFFLPDGTKVWLNSASTIKFPSVFAGKTRTIQLDGEAYFEVSVNKEKPFIVKSGALDVTALGTAFNLCAYSEDNQISATLAEGKVKITTHQGKKEQFILKPDEQLNLEKTTLKISKTNVKVYDVIAWKDGKLIFNETPFHEVVVKLGRWFNTEIKLADESISSSPYTATFTNENLSQVMELLTFSAPIEFTSTNREIQKDNNFSPKQIIIHVKPGAIPDSNIKNKTPMK